MWNFFRRPTVRHSIAGSVGAILSAAAMFILPWEGYFGHTYKDIVGVDTGRSLVALNVDKTWDNAIATRGKLDTFMPATVRGGHAVCCVGYTADRASSSATVGVRLGATRVLRMPARLISMPDSSPSYGVTI